MLFSLLSVFSACSNRPFFMVAREVLYTMTTGEILFCARKYYSNGLLRMVYTCFFKYSSEFQNVRDGTHNKVLTSIYSFLLSSRANVDGPGRIE